FVAGSKTVRGGYVSREFESLPPPFLALLTGGGPPPRRTRRPRSRAKPLLRSPRPERCPSGRRNATGNRVPAERWVEGSNPSPSASLAGLDASRPASRR